jgi:hypothetical protein
VPVQFRSNSYARCGPRWIAFLTLGLFAAVFGVAFAQSYTFSLNPKDGQVDVVRMVTSLTVTPGFEPPVSQRAEWLIESTAKKYINGLAITTRPLSYEMWYNGEPLGEGIGDALSDSAFTFLVDLRGELREIKGLDTFQAALQRSIPSHQVDSMAPELTRILGTALMQMWENEVGALFGKDFTVGEVWVGSDVAELPVVGKVPYASGYVFEEIIPCENAKCVRIILSYYADQRAAYRALGPKIGPDFEIPLAGRTVPGVVELTSGIEVSGEGEWIVNPATGDTIEMRITKRFQYSANYQGKLEVPFSLVETMNIKLEKTGVSESKEKQ